MAGFVDELVEAALHEPKGLQKEAGKFVEVDESPDWERLAAELDKQASEDLHVHESKMASKTDGLRMRKLAMATILDVIDDPKCQSKLMSVSSEIQGFAKSAFESPESGSVGELSQATGSESPAYVKHKVGKGKTLFEKMKTDNGSAPGSNSKE